MTTEYSKIQSALNHHLSTMVGKPDVVAYENLTVSPPESELYLILRFKPDEPDYPDVGISAKAFESGIFQCVSAALPGSGWGLAYNQADNIMERFKQGVVINHNDINVRILLSYPGPGIIQDGRYQVPVNIRYFGYY